MRTTDWRHLERRNVINVATPLPFVINLNRQLQGVFSRHNSLHYIIHIHIYYNALRPILVILRDTQLKDSNDEYCCECSFLVFDVGNVLCSGNLGFKSRPWNLSAFFYLPQSLRQIPRWHLKSRHGRLLTHHSQFIIHLSSQHKELKTDLLSWLWGREGKMVCMRATWNSVQERSARRYIFIWTILDSRHFISV